MYRYRDLFEERQGAVERQKEYKEAGPYSKEREVGMSWDKEGRKERRKEGRSRYKYGAVRKGGLLYTMELKVREIE